MAEIAQNHRKGRKKGRAKKLSTRVDFTPMVDLGFLLITFFMLATTLNKPQTMEIALPSKDKTSEEEQTNIKASRSVVILLGKDNAVYYYEGTRENGVDPLLYKTNFSARDVNYKVFYETDTMKLIKYLRSHRDCVKAFSSIYEVVGKQPVVELMVLILKMMDNNPTNRPTASEILDNHLFDGLKNN